MPAEEMVSVRSAAPGSVATGMCRTPKVRCSYTSSVTMTASYFGGQFDDALQHLAGEHRAGGVVRIVDQHHLGAVAERGLECGQVRHEIRGQERGGDVRGAGEPDDGAIGVVERLEGEHLIARTYQREQRGGDGLGGAGGDDDFGLRIRGQPVEPLLVDRDRLPQRQDALAGRILVGSGGDGGLGGLLDLHGAVLVREALAEVDGARAAGPGWSSPRRSSRPASRRGRAGWRRLRRAATATACGELIGCPPSRPGR